MHLERMNLFPSLGHFEWVSQPFSAKKACLRAETAWCWEGTNPFFATGTVSHR